LERISQEYENEIMDNQTIYNIGYSMESLLKHGKEIRNIKYYSLDLFEFKNSFGVNNNSNIKYAYRIYIEDANGNKQTMYIELA
ncbi:MAG: hypothetical protein R6V39_07340, partial [Desulfovibrionales bacterium]